MKIGLKLHHRSVITYSYCRRKLIGNYRLYFITITSKDAVKQPHFVISVPFSDALCVQTNAKTKNFIIFFLVLPNNIKLLVITILILEDKNNSLYHFILVSTINKVIENHIFDNCERQESFYFHLSKILNKSFILCETYAL